ncbi:XdhC/CoxI family protein [Bacillus sp. B15-48]|uniref:XdhC family protein n=1 Tax=Bacillus sp. B15-48 TaxID=1548601 RepID=UPI0019400577|nr:XdhC/CoxI family protein [Bacillus sp. B15-48]MBM4763550.1 XdhC/CoxI family protein [Bacillus sp. B15-48]
MSSKKELHEILERGEKVSERGEKAAFLMLMEISGSSYRRPGAKMMIASDGEISGTLSGGCLEKDLLEYAKIAIAQNKPMVKTYDLSENELWGLGVGCNGAVDVLILPLEQHSTFWGKVKEEVSFNRIFHLIFEVESGEGWLIDTSNQVIYQTDNDLPMEVIQRVHSNDQKHKHLTKVIHFNDVRYVIDSVQPLEKLIICGAGDDAVPVVDLAIKANFDVTVLDPRPLLNHASRFPNAKHFVQEPFNLKPNPLTLNNAWWVIMNHHMERDKAALKLALESRPKYVGVLGPVRRTDQLLENLSISAENLPLYAPIGLDLGAETVEEVAISIVSELLALRNHKQSLHLKGKGKIHD